MHPMGMLGPIDASIVDPLGPSTKCPASGTCQRQDVAAYYALVREDLGIRHEAEFVQAFRVLAENVHPLALGSVKEGSTQSRMLGEKLIGLRSNVGAQRLELLERLTTKLTTTAIRSTGSRQRSSVCPWQILRRLSRRLSGAHIWRTRAI